MFEEHSALRGTIIDEVSHSIQCHYLRVVVDQFLALVEIDLYLVLLFRQIVWQDITGSA